MIEPGQVLRTSSSILLIDWPRTGIPRTLVEAGFSVFGFSTGGYSVAELHREPPKDVEPSSVFPPKGPAENGFLVFRRLPSAPPHVDIVHVFRPAQELAGIITTQVAKLGAKTLWLQPPLMSAEAGRLAEELGVAFVEGVDIAETTLRFKVHK